MLAAIPTLLGAVPHESLVIVGIGTRGELSPVARVDLDACAHADAARAVARECTGHLARAGAHSLVIIAFSEREHSPQALNYLRDGLRGAFDVSDTWVVTAGRYRSPDCDDLACCPRLGRALPPAPPNPMTRYGSTGASQSGSHRLAPTVPRQVRKPAREAFRREINAQRAVSSGWRQHMLNMWRAAHILMKRGNMPRASHIGRLAAGLRDTAVRDAIVINLVPGEHEVANRLCDADETGVREALARMIGIDDPLHPPQEDLEAAIALAEHIAWVCPEVLGAAYAIIAIARWWTGDLEAAEAAVTASLDAEPGYRLAELIAAALEVNMPPGWLRVA